ncbi:MAG: hypothetical protein JSW20_14390 [Nitrospiraceae bacterium]|nr:MAG: hypothetical protein JSW20_14390 [Nitrospiraceae bacterium]
MHVIHRCFLLVYTVVASVLLGGLIGFLLVYPFLQILFDALGNEYKYDQMIHYFVYFIVILSIGYCFQINWKRFQKHTRKKEADS